MTDRRRRRRAFSQVFAFPAAIIILALTTGCVSSSAESELAVLDTTVSIDRVVLANLGEEHIRNTAYRRTADGAYIAAWGQRIIEWTLPGPSDQIERVPVRDDIWFSNGGSVMDVDEDGDEDLVIGRTHTKSGRTTTVVWYEDTGTQPWTEHTLATISHGAWDAPHDIRPLDVDGRRGVAVVFGRQQLIYFEIGDDPTQAWTRYDIGSLPTGGQSGMLIEDVNMDGREDVVVGMFYAATPAELDDEPWSLHRFGVLDKDDRGGMAKHAWLEVASDDRKVLAVAQAEIPGATLGLYAPGRNPDGDTWFQLIDSTLYAPHSMVSADVNADGRTDLVVGEMSAGGWDYPMNDRPTLYAFLQDASGGFRKTILEEDVGIHELGLAPDRVDGRHMIYGADEVQPQKFEGMNTHVSYWLIGPMNSPTERQPSQE